MLAMRLNLFHFFKCVCSCRLSAKTISYDEKLEQTTFDFSDTLAAQTKATLSIKYTGSINDKLAGFYRSEYKNKEGETK